MATKDGSDVLTPSNSALTLAHACEAVGLDSDGAALMRIGSNAVYRLREPVVARISRNGAALKEAQTAIAVARWLETSEFPAVRALYVEQPVKVDQRVVTFWTALSDDGDEYASVAEIANVLSKLHSLVPPKGLDLPVLAPFDRADLRIENSNGVSAEDRRFLAERLADLRESYAKLEFNLPQGVIHGDASVGNVLKDRDGKAVLIDLDGFAIGPREWDLVLTAVYFDRFGWHTKEEYETFVSVYGFDIMRWAGYPVLRDVREFLMVTWLSQKADENQQTADEARKRIDSLRTGASRKNWKPY
jgi:aminoglycoside phosphotransferase (APT) family kinase protein